MATEGEADKKGTTSVGIVRSSTVCLLTPGVGGRRQKSQPPWTKVKLTLSRSELEYHDEPEAEQLSPPSRAAVTGASSRFLLEDLVGVEVRDLPPPHDKNACQTNVHFFSKRTEKKKMVRRMNILSFCFDSAESFTENRAQAEEWRKDIKLYCHYRRNRVLHSTQTEEVDAEEPVPPRQRRLLVFINPVSGQGKGVSEFKEHVKPLFDLAEIDYEPIVTERQNYAKDQIKTYDLSTIDGIVIASGDGLLYEVVNGMMERDDWEQAMKTPIGMLPLGSGNALCASSLYEAGEDYSLLNAAFQIIQGGVIPMDITTVETADNKTLYMTILGGWGLLSDIDIESESMRKIGETRFLIGALNCIRRKRIYRGKLAYLPWDETETLTPLSKSAPAEKSPLSAFSVPPSSPPDLVTTSLNPQLLSRGGAPSLKSDGPESIVESANEEDAVGGHLSSEESEKEKSDIFEETQGIMLDEESSIHIQQPTTTTGGYLQEKAQPKGQTETKDETHDWEFVKDPSKDTKKKVEHTAPIKISYSSPSTSPPATEPQVMPASLRTNYTSSGPTPTLLPEITQDIPDHWKVIEGEFLTISPLMIPHLSSNFFGDPKMSIGTGKIRLMYARKMSRLGMLSLLTKAEKGTHLDREEIEIVDAKAFRLVPQTDTGILTVDGEVVKYGPLQAQVHQHLARVFCSKKVV